MDQFFDAETDHFISVAITMLVCGAFALAVRYVVPLILDESARQPKVEGEPQSLVGTRVGSYQLDRWLGAEGFAQWYEATQVALNERCRIKLLLSEHVTELQRKEFTDIAVKESAEADSGLLDFGHTVQGDLFVAYGGGPGELTRERMLRAMLQQAVQPPKPTSSK